MENETKIPLFRRFVIQNFPYIEQDFDALTDYQLISKIVEYLNKVIESQNGLVDDMNDLQTAFNTLKDYVDHYFDNLDVQEEINNKLDAMVEAGTLQEIIGEYLNSTAIWGFDNVASMKSSTNLINGSFAKTLGYYAKNDGGGATYKIRTVTNDDTIDEMFILEIGDEENQLVAELIFDDEINIKQIGAKPLSTDGTKTDIKNYIDRYIAVQENQNKTFKLYIPSGIWHTSGNLLYGKNGWNITGDGRLTRFHTYGDGTIITSYTENQDYIFRLGDSSHSCHNWVLENITFTSAEFEYSSDTFNFSTVKTIKKALELHHAVFGITDNLFFNNIAGKAFTINGSWGNYFKLLNFYKISNENGSIMNFEKVDSTLGAGAGIIGNTFENIMFEMVHGHCMNFEDNCNVYNNQFGTIRVEPGAYNIDDRTYTNFTSEILATWDDTDCTHYAVMNMAYNCKVAENTFNNINLNNVAHAYYTLDTNKYVYDTVIKYNNSCICNNIYNNINNNGMLKDCKVIYLPSTVTSVIANRGFNTFNNFETGDDKNFIFDVAGLNDLNVNVDTYLHGSRATYSFANQNAEYFKFGGWIPAYKAISKRGLSSGIGYLFYDKDTFNNLSLAVQPRTDVTDIAYINTTVNPSKKLYLRAKIPDDETCKINVNDRTASDTLEVTLTGTGSYTIYEIELTNTWNIGDYIRLTQGGTSADVRHIMVDSFLSA